MHILMNSDSHSNRFRAFNPSVSKESLRSISDTDSDLFGYWFYTILDIDRTSGDKFSDHPSSDSL